MKVALVYNRVTPLAVMKSEFRVRDIKRDDLNRVLQRCDVLVNDIYQDHSTPTFQAVWIRSRR
jgi:hypothetical protein